MRHVHATAGFIAVITSLSNVTTPDTDSCWDTSYRPMLRHHIQTHPETQATNSCWDNRYKLALRHHIQTGAETSQADRCWDTRYRLAMCWDTDLCWDTTYKICVDTHTRRIIDHLSLCTILHTIRYVWSDWSMTAGLGLRNCYTTKMLAYWAQLAPRFWIETKQVQTLLLYQLSLACQILSLMWECPLTHINSMPTHSCPHAHFNRGDNDWSHYRRHIPDDVIADWLADSAGWTSFKYFVLRDWRK